MNSSVLKYWMAIAMFINLAACEKVVDIAVKDLEPSLVVEATIENGTPPMVILTRSFTFFNALTADDLSKSFVHDAKVVLSDGVKTMELYESNISFPGLQLFFYTLPNNDPDNSIIGKLNTKYSLSILVDGQQYNAETQIPNINTKMDSLWWEQAPNNPDTNKVVVYARIIDPPGLGNYSRYFTSQNNSAFLPGLNSINNDQLTDGKTYTVPVFKGQNRNQDFTEDEFGYFKRGDTVLVKLSNINKATFDFWRTWEQSQQNQGNPFGVPVKVLGNISNNALGYFGGYAAQIEKIIIPR